MLHVTEEWPVDFGEAPGGRGPRHAALAQHGHTSNYRSLGKTMQGSWGRVCAPNCLLCLARLVHLCNSPVQRLAATEWADWAQAQHRRSPVRKAEAAESE